MYPHVGVSPVNLDQFPALQGVLDVIYNPARTQLLMDAQDRGLITENGLWMLVAQAKESSEWFQGKTVSDDLIAKIHCMLRRQMKNIMLIGMPGSGKSTIGLCLSEQLGKKFVDADALIRQQAGCSIPEIFDNFGEDGFRQIETKVLAQIGMESGLVIATGGGCVTREINYRHLHQNGSIYWIKRNLDLLPTDGRPLSQKCKLEDMYQIRKPMYEAFADHTIMNDTTVSEAVRQIMAAEGYL
jgi:shikimate dehydrogenase